MESVYCIECGKRLFDKDKSLQGKLEIKCTRCRKVQKRNFTANNDTSTYRKIGTNTA